MMNTEQYNRFNDLPWNKEALDVVVGGAGGIGSWLTLFLSRIGHNIYLFDHDKVEEVNIGGQFYSKDNIDKYKSRECYNNVLKFSNKYINPCLKYTDQYMPIMFSCFDNMEARKSMFNVWSSEPDRQIFIDGRMLAEQMQIFTLTSDDEENIEKYRDEYLFDDSEVEDQPCSARATSHCGAMIASYMTSIFTNYLSNKYQGFDIRNVPFSLKIDLPILTHNIEFNDAIENSL